MFPDYEAAVFADYQQKKLSNALSLRLAHPTPGKLKGECIVILNRRYTVKDNKALSDFFELDNSEGISEQVIRKFDRDKFKPLSNFLKNPNINTDPKNIELLAWLIDFQPRPYDFERKYGAADPITTEREQEQIQQGNGHGLGVSLNQVTDGGEKNEKITPLTIFSGKPYFKFKSIAVFALILIFLIVSAMVYWSLQKKYPRTNLTGQERCMYWVGDHYEPISCSQGHGDTLVIGLDSVKLTQFKKITRPDTITKDDIGKVWYIKIKGNLEFYTAAGNHPVDPMLRLRPITNYIIDKYLESGKK